MGMEIEPQKFTQKQLSKHNTEDNCYIAIDYLVFDWSNKTSDSEFISVEDCGKDLKDTVDVNELEEKELNNFVGYMEEIIEWDSEEEIQKKIDSEVVFETTKEEKKDEEFWTLSNISVGLSILILLVLVTITLVTYIRTRKII